MLARCKCLSIPCCARFVRGCGDGLRAEIDGGDLNDMISVQDWTREPNLLATIDVYSRALSSLKKPGQTRFHDFI